jgi:hypothetical protein
MSDQQLQETTARLPECVMERFTLGGAKWHVCRGEGSDTFQPILCHETEGINMPANKVRRQPTCIECYAAWRRVLTVDRREATP